MSLSLSPSLAPIAIVSTANRSQEISEAAEQLSFRTKKHLSTSDTPSRLPANGKKKKNALRMFENILENRRKKKHFHRGYQFEITKEPNHSVEWEDVNVAEQVLTKKNK